KDYSGGTNPNRSARRALVNLKKRAANPITGGTHEGIDERLSWDERRKKTVVDPNVRGARQAPEPGEPNAFHPLGSNLRNVWTIATEPYPEAHFATFPMELPMRCIKIGTSEAGCCEQCGAPRRRIINKEYFQSPVHGEASVMGRKEASGQNNFDGQGNPRVNAAVTTRGFEPSCDCNAAIVPCRVLDPFMGSGTTMAAAFELGRDAVGYELNPEYVELAERRPQIRERREYAAAMRGEALAALTGGHGDTPLFAGDEGEGAA
ncbi:MAG TPA: DNA methyltransferase, partial [Candidatus Baltobacteraceae bacterium]|nr:DNA methyltransferase [Candidatus Baltobacteraceae bacterium]